MLSSLKIENVAVIEYSEIVFDAGLNILTGETGAGKSIVIDSINAILGERTSREIIRDGCDKAKVTAYFENVSDDVLEKLREFDIDADDDRGVLINRVISTDGRGSCRINGCNVTVSMLKAVGRELMTICGQHDSQHLLDADKHIAYIDSLADDNDLKSEYAATFRELKDVRKKLKRLLDDEDEKDRKLEILKYQINELSSANLIIGEKARLTEEKKKITNREKIIRALGNAEMILGGDDSAIGLSEGIYRLCECFSQLSAYDSDFGELSESLENCKYIFEECSKLVSSSASGFDDEYTDINFIEERLDTIYRLSRKYGETEEKMLGYLSSIEKEYNEIASSDELIEELSIKYTELENELFRKGCLLSDVRKEAAMDFEQKVTKQLHFLDMPSACFEVNFGEAPATEDGMDDIEFLFSANAGQEPKSLSKIASGGELSRVMLAIRCVLSDRDGIASIVFDEIDTGVSGRAAHKIAHKMHELSKSNQVMCVTHLAQIAAYADNHLYIEKITHSDSTYTKVNSLSDSERIREIARIIGGDIITQTTLDSARELISYAEADEGIYS